MKTGKLVALFMVFVMCITTLPVFAAEQQFEKYRFSGDTIDEILNEYEMMKTNIKRDISDTMPDGEHTYRSRVDALRAARNSALMEAGFVPYEVNQSNFLLMENTLQCDLNEIGLNPMGSYLIILGGDEICSESRTIGDAPARGAGASFSYEYNGLTLTMRTMTVYPGDEGEEMGNQAPDEHVDILDSTSYSVINNAFNGLVCLYTGAVNWYAGALYTLAGINLSLIGNSPWNSSTAVLFGGAVWTRVYTQVWSSYDQVWTYGTMVERVTASCHVSGTYYNASTQSIVHYSTSSNPEIEETFSSKYSNTYWKRENAAINYYYSSPCDYDITGSVYFYHDGDLVLTLGEPNYI